MCRPSRCAVRVRASLPGPPLHADVETAIAACAAVGGVPGRHFAAFRTNALWVLESGGVLVDQGEAPNLQVEFERVRDDLGADSDRLLTRNLMQFPSQKS